MKEMKDRIVLIDWLDTASEGAWTAEREMNLTECQSVGWVIHVTAKTVVIASHLNNEGEVGDRTVIPRSTIKSMRPLDVTA